MGVEWQSAQPWLIVARKAGLGRGFASSARRRASIARPTWPLSKFGNQPVLSPSGGEQASTTSGCRSAGHKV